MEKILTPYHELPLVSVIIPVYNGGNYLRQAIDSVINQTYPNIEIIVVNDGSHDDGETEKIATSYGEKIIYLKKENGGVSSALNFGIRQMRGKFFSWLSHDDRYLPSKIESQVSFLLSNPSVDLVYGNYELLEGANTDAFCVTANRDFPSIYPIFHLFRRQTNICTCLIKKNLFDKIGLFKEQSQTTQDYEFLFDAFRYFECRYLNQTFVQTRIHDSQGSKTIRGHVSNAERMWINFIENLSQKEYEELGGKLNFLKDSRCYFLNTPYKKVSEFCQKLLLPKGLYEDKVDLLLVYLPFDWINKKGKETSKENIKVRFFQNLSLDKEDGSYPDPITQILSVSTLESLISKLAFSYSNFTYIAFISSDQTLHLESLINKIIQMRCSLSNCGVVARMVKNRLLLWDSRWNDFVVRLDYLTNLPSITTPFNAIVDFEKITKVIYFEDKLSFLPKNGLEFKDLDKCARLVLGSNILSRREKLSKFIFTELLLRNINSRGNPFLKIFAYFIEEGFYSTMARILNKVRKVFSNLSKN